MSDNLNIDTDETRMLEPAVPRGAIWTVALVFAILYGWFLFSAIGNLVGLPSLYEAFDAADRIPWVPLILGVAIPPVAYAVALGAGRGRALSTRVVVFAAGLAAVAATALTVYVLGI